MGESQAVAVTAPPISPLTAAFQPVMTVEEAVKRKQELHKFIALNFELGVDLGTIPGTETRRCPVCNQTNTIVPTKDWRKLCERANGGCGKVFSDHVLYLAGAQKLCYYYGLRAEFAIVDKVNDWTGEAHGGTPFHSYLTKCTLYHNGRVVGEGYGECNAWEPKYKYLHAERLCPNCKKPAIIINRYSGDKWLCWAKKDGCGAKFPEGNAEIEGQKVGKIINPDLAGLVNTFVKMSMKRSYVGGVVYVTSASEIFKQDIGDDPADQPEDEPGGKEQTTSRPEAKQRPRQGKAPAESNGEPQRNDGAPPVGTARAANGPAQAKPQAANGP